MMMSNAALTPADQAARLLAAWASGNPAGLREELRRSLELDCPGHPRSFQEEQLQLLRAAAEGMRFCLDPLRQADPKLQRCLDLLRHLAETP